MREALSEEQQQKIAHAVEVNDKINEAANQLKEVLEGMKKPEETDDNAEAESEEKKGDEE